MLGISLAHCTLAKADAPWESGLVHHWIGMDWNEQILTLQIT